MIKHELRNLLSGTGKTKQGNLIQAIAGYLAAGKATGEKTEIKKLTKQEETKLITEYVNLHHHWNTRIDESRFIAESRVSSLAPEHNITIKVLEDRSEAICYHKYYSHNLLM